VVRLSHQDARRYLHQAADGDLSAEVEARLQAHLAECAECRAYADELQAVELLLTRALHARWDHRRPARALNPRLAPQPRAATWLREVIRLTGPFMQVSSFMIVFAFVVGLLQAYYRPYAAPTEAPLQETTSQPQSAPSVVRSYPNVPDAGLEQADLDLYRLSDIFAAHPLPVPDDAPSPRRVSGMIPN
jgi:hypothetical protein